MDLHDELSEVNRALDDARAQSARWEARVAGLIAQRDALLRLAAAHRHQPEAQAGADLTLFSRTDALAQVLQMARRPLAIREILSELKNAGRTDDSYSVVAATLAQMVRYGRVIRPRRGYYAAS